MEKSSSQTNLIKRSEQQILVDVLNLEAQAIIDAAKRIGSYEVQQLVSLFEQLIAHGGGLVFCGVGKSGHIAQKLAATFSSLGINSFFLHPTEALHGDLGRLRSGDAVVLISKSGTSEEVAKILPFLPVAKDMRIGLIGNSNSHLAKSVGILLDCSVAQEACINNQAPTTSSTVAMAMGDAMAVLFENHCRYRPLSIRTQPPWRCIGEIPSLAGQGLDVAFIANCDFVS